MSLSVLQNQFLHMYVIDYLYNYDLEINAYLRAKDDYARAIGDYTRAIELDPDYADAGRASDLGTGRQYVSG